MALSENKERQVQYPHLRKTRHFAVAGGEHIYNGALVAVDASGDLIPAVGTNRCVGVAADELDNSGAVGASETTIPVDIAQVEVLSLTGADKSDVGRFVWATDDETLTFTSNTCLVGRIIDSPQADTIHVEITG